MFKSFSETSRLYAQNYSVIEAVKAEFQKDVDTFLDSVYEEIQTATAGKSRQEIAKARNRSWWIEGRDKDSYPYLWVWGSAPGIVYPGEVELQACAPNASPGQLRALKDVASRQEFSRICEGGTGKPGPYSLFTATIKYGDEDPVQHVSRVAASLILALNDAYERASHAAPASGGKQKVLRRRHP
jgi:hypothetical protein